ncbi:MULTISPECIES: type I-B CRISPR-associated protein Cas5b [Bacillus]|uniref:CRISPR-associated protein cas5, subtype I-b/tneap n=1 Tax=Bacillus smithii 7_3_47FAA TaxID=665952 RepID=G9QHB6_9BACI|nr:type I-B CRISPR-associated protein Cas5b [Bacillus smithii]EHL79449.1 CRISPR-associated protein cas5, subtype I-b/tneap [Bacillus smithii 7_3_47FAA]
MKALRLKLYQQTACYKKPFAFKVSETYPLPPYSTVKGMLHAVLKANSLIPMKISIQGKYDTLVTDYQTHYFFKKDQTKEFALTFDGLGYEPILVDVTTMPIYMHMLYDVELLIHVQADEDVLLDLERNLKTTTTHLSLGRWEDLVRIDRCEMVELSDCEDEPVLKYNAYVPMKMITDETYFPYKLNWTYRIIQGVRVWNKIPVGYMLAGEPIGEFDSLSLDPYGDLVFFP